MKILVYIIFLLMGTVLAYLFLESQRWSVMNIKPDLPKSSQWLIVGGAIIRWLIIFFVLMLAIKHSIISMFILFFSFMFSRLMLLVRLQRVPTVKNPISIIIMKD